MELTKHIGIDLGTANTVISCRGKGVVLQEPSVVAVHSKSGMVLAVGNSAKKMIGKTPEDVIAVQPIQNGVIADFDAAQAMLRAFVEQACPGGVFRPQVTVCVPFGVTEVEKRAVLEAVSRSGGKNTFVMESPMAAAFGAELPIDEATGSMVLDIGGGIAETVIVSFGGIVAGSCVRGAGSKMDADILEYIKETHGLFIGERTAEEIKMTIGAVHSSCEEKQMRVMGRDVNSGLPKEIVIKTTDVREAIERTVQRILFSVQTTLEKTPPELVADIAERGIVLSGGGANLPGLDLRIRETTGILARRVENAQECVALGATVATSAFLENQILRSGKRFFGQSVRGRAGA